MHTREEKIAAFGRLLDIMDTLREQCPWNAAQTFESIRPLSEEEVYELSDTILKGDRNGTAKELGDLSENDEYRSARREFGRNNSRITYLENMIRTAVIIEDEFKAEQIMIELPGSLDIFNYDQ